ncbi:hypothetical protein ZWY2020_056979 [Hordeum vulgare]|nr:hypothetical protein ZWY2020_056979 [Hordeum vulgare]
MQDLHCTRLSVRVKEGADDASRARMNSEMKAIRPSLSAKSVGTLSKSRKGALSKQVISRLSMSVVALTSFDGDTKLRECTGSCIESSCPDATCFLTSKNLIPYTYPRRKIAESLAIKVRLPDDQIVTGLSLIGRAAWSIFDLQGGQWVTGFQATADTVNGFSFHPYLPLATTSSGHRRFGMQDEFEEESSLAGDENCCSFWKFSCSQEA